ncbi:hypothetical protein [Paenibacillus spongiae]|uniref:DUF1642 domain-containing protein n=1 Tax=Paenibacillus spongiae TaxID=2909671 RepID=A0ABY5SDR1_9BACL|nr:hypothetical protein [Paenibacillus spongiae]UVI32071.1 hypothetical protein L1F29_09740 [Paenibacillus spongiae]
MSMSIMKMNEQDFEQVAAIARKINRLCQECEAIIAKYEPSLDNMTEEEIHQLDINIDRSIDDFKTWIKVWYGKDSEAYRLADYFIHSQEAVEDFCSNYFSGNRDNVTDDLERYGRYCFEQCYEAINNEPIWQSDM